MKGLVISWMFVSSINQWMAFVRDGYGYVFVKQYERSPETYQQFMNDLKQEGII